ncbi:PREDICTED: calpain-2 catalytic subunit-like, partial [Tauraco erythrolophus]|uniref:calpain-2 catalytic subunit-like n=1 Tax=Tauraco erythrolophus TaxID=121530 RepID=UPI000523C367
QDIKSDGFSIETCKIMVDLLDNDGSGKLGLKEFHTLWTKIQKYQKIYREIDVDRSGTMNSYEMRRALETAGFKLNCQLHQIIVARFADEDLIIDFDNFVRCLIRLETLFSQVTLTLLAEILADTDANFFPAFSGNNRVKPRCSSDSRYCLCLLLSAPCVPCGKD